MRLRPQKSLGQHFLRDPNVIRRICAAVGVAAGETVLEIGPGEGAMTGPLADAGAHLVAIEVDRRAVEGLRREFGTRVRVVEQDILTLDLGAYAREAGAPVRIVGNIPYNITSPILFHLLDHRDSVRDATLMIQREVAQRLVADPGCKEYGILSVTFQMWADVETLFDVPPAAFRPVPEVHSTVLRLRMLPGPRVPLADEGFFREMVRTVFGQRRKMLRNSLQAFAAKRGRALPVEFMLEERPEALSPASLADLANRLHEAFGRRKD
jgi:16S rRNA (adenine1518-N6/adenine1519-N6)-dimethyltransferase